MNAQGEDVVAGIRTPSPISALADTQPEVYAQFEKIADTLEKHYRDMQDMEFTIERGKLYMLQTRDVYKRQVIAAGLIGGGVAAAALAALYLMLGKPCLLYTSRCV